MTTGSTVIHPTTWTQFAAPTDTSSGYVEADYNGANRGYLYSELEPPSGIPAGATVTNVLMTVTCQNDNGSGFVPLGWFSPLSQVGFSIDPGASGNGGFGPVDGDLNVVSVGTTPAAIEYDFLALLNDEETSIPDFDAWAANLGAADPLCVTVTCQSTFHSPGWLRYLTDSDSWFITIEWETAGIDLPCDTDVALDLSTAQFTEVDSMPFGQYGDGVIYGYIRSPATTPSYPDFFFALEDLDPVKRYAVTVTFDPSSAHDSGGRSFTLTGVEPGSETDFNTVDGFPIGDLYDGSGNTDDSVTVRIGPGIGGWDDATYGVAAGFSRLFFETDRDGAVSGITIRKVCTSFAPPLRLTNRDDMFASARRLTGSSSRQASNRLTGYL